MTDPKRKLTPEEKEAFRRDRKVMEVLNQANQDTESSIRDLFPNAIEVSEIHYWAPVDRPDGWVRLREAILLGADVNEKRDGDYTPLHGAAENGALENAKLLVALGADVSARTVDGKTPLDLAMDRGHGRVVDFLGSQFRQ